MPSLADIPNFRTPWLSPPGEGPEQQACSMACAGFRRLPRVGWPDYGMCDNPDSPRDGFPVLLGQACPYARLRPESREA